ncbi:hypothetical protein [uncultured Clostridium sp.]|nr:hypothetical protein [uncultured Clostridium sp.]
MKNKMLRNMKSKMRKSKMKNNILVEMAEDMKDIIAKAKKYKKMK